MKWRDLRGSELLRAENGARRSRSPAGSRRRRDHGGLIFVDLRDEGGLVQLVLNPEHAAEAAAAAHELRNEFVIRATRPSSAARPRPSTRRWRPGRSRCRRPSSRSSRARRRCRSSSTRRASTRRCGIRYRWLDLRRERMQRNIRTRGEARLDHPLRDGGGGLHRHRDADHGQADARGRARLPRPDAPPARPVLRAARRARRSTSSCSSSPASSATTRSPAASGTRICAPTGSRS